MVLIKAWKGVRDDPRIFYSRFDGSTWTPQQVLPDRGTSTSPALANWHVFSGDPLRLDERIYMAWKGVRDDPRIFYSVSFDGSTWTPQQVLPDRGTSTSPALATLNKQEGMYMAWKGVRDDPRIFYSRFDGSTWTPQQVLPDRGTSTSPALANFVLPS